MVSLSSVASVQVKVRVLGLLKPQLLAIPGS